MGIVNSTFTDNSNPLEKLTKALKLMGSTMPEASFKDQRGKEAITRTYLEMVISEYAQSQQNPQLFNKWLQIDTKFDKALREYKSDVQMLIAGVTQLGQAQQTVAEPVDMPGPASAPPPAPSPKLPTQ
jgi:hypothetical protein